MLRVKLRFYVVILFTAHYMMLNIRKWNKCMQNELQHREEKTVHIGFIIQNVKSGIINFRNIHVNNIICIST